MDRYVWMPNNMCLVHGEEGEHDNIEGISQRYITPNPLKEEAIKWVKQLRDIASEFKPYDESFSHSDWLQKISDIFGWEVTELANDYFEDNVWLSGCSSMLTKFFNITQEDLK